MNEARPVGVTSRLTENMKVLDMLVDFDEFLRRKKIKLSHVVSSKIDSRLLLNRKCHDEFPEGEAQMRDKPVRGLRPVAVCCVVDSLFHLHSYSQSLHVRHRHYFVFPAFIRRKKQSKRHSQHMSINFCLIWCHE